MFRGSRRSVHFITHPSKITIAAAGGTVLVAAAVASAMTLGPVSPADGSLAAAAQRGTGPGWQGARSHTDSQLRLPSQVPAVTRLRTINLLASEQAVVRQQAAAAAAQRAREEAQQQAQERAQQAAQQAPAQPAPVVPAGAAQQIAAGMLASYGWSSGQFSCLVSLWNEESGWRVTADNPSSGAYGIPQALPGYKMASAGPDWQTDAATQIRWGLGYIRGQYGSPCGAWDHEEADGWY